ncbi:Conserved_hypothetical protein [Hexamita inflata]|uniref:CFA20 domain-containing protein n=1 Tax=Hexamita inflata TaxID=28002 RepID=A0AA86NDF5_9EUKA|nr:Conserved hypothetical protein [Hexamita inflata]
MDTVGQNKITFPKLTDLKFSNCVDLFKTYQVPKQNYQKVGQVFSDLDHVIKKQVIYARGTVSSANRFSVPAKINPQVCTLPHQNCYIQIAPDISYHTDKEDNSISGSHCVVTLTCQATNGTQIRVALSTLVSGPKASANTIYIPLRLKRWTTIVLNLHNLFEKVFNGSLRYAGFLQVDVSATCAVKGLYFSNIKYSPYDAPQIMYLPPPPKQPANTPNLINYYDWLECGFEAIQHQRTPDYLISKKDIFSQNIGFAILVEKFLDDFAPEMEKYELQVTNQKSLLQKKKQLMEETRKEPVTTKSRISQELSTYHASAPQIQAPPVVQEPIVEEVIEQEVEPEPEEQPEPEPEPEENIEISPIPLQNSTSHSQEIKNRLSQLLNKNPAQIPTDLTQSELNTLENAVLHGTKVIENNYKTEEHKKVTINKKDFNPAIIQALNNVHTTFLTDAQVKQLTFNKSIDKYSNYSLLQVLYVIGCEQENGFSNQCSFDQEETLEQHYKVDQLKAISTNQVQQAVVKFINLTLRGNILYFKNNQIMVNKMNRKFQTNFVHLYSQLDLLLLNHKHIASVFSKELLEQIVISHGLVLQNLIQMIPTKPEVNAIIQRLTPGPVLFMCACNTSQHFLIIFQHYLCLFEFSLLNKEEQIKLNENKKISLKLRALGFTSDSQITHFECASFNGQKLFLVGTNKGKATLNAAYYDLQCLTSLGDGWMQQNQKEFTILDKPITLESLHNQQIHQEIFKIIDLTDTTFLTISNKQMRIFRLKENQLKHLIIAYDFVYEQQEIIQQFQHKMLNSELLKENEKSEMFTKTLNQAIELIVQSTLITDAGVVPNTNNEQMYIVLNGAALITTDISKLLAKNQKTKSIYIYHQFIPISFALMFNEDKIISTDLSNRLMFNQLIENNVQPLSSNITFNHQIVDLQRLQNDNKLSQEDIERLQSSNLFSKYEKSSQKSELANQVQFSIVQSVGEYGIITISDNEDNLYDSIYQSVMSKILDFQFDPVHPEEIAIIADATLNVFSNQSRKILLNVDINEQMTFKQNQNVMCYSPTKYVLAYYLQTANGFSLVDLDQRECIYASKEVFKNIQQPGFALEDAKISISFSRSGNNLLLSNSQSNLVCYDTKDVIQFSFSFDIKLQSFQMAQINNSGSFTDVVVGLDLQGNVQLATLAGLKNRHGFKQLNIQKQKLQYIIDRRLNLQYVAPASITSQFYVKQRQHLISTLSDALNSRSDCPSTKLIQLQALARQADIENPRLVRRFAVNIQTSVCLPNILGVLVIDLYSIPDKSDMTRQQFAHCVSVESYDLQSGACVQSYFITTVIQNQENELFKTFLMQNRVYGTYLLAVSGGNQTIIQNVNCLFSEPKQQRVAVLGFEVINIQQSADSQRIALCSNQQSLFVFQWNCSDFGEEEQLANMADAVMSKRLEGVASNSGSVFQVYVGSRSELG